MGEGTKKLLQPGSVEIMRKLTEVQTQEKSKKSPCWKKQKENKEKMGDTG